MTTQKRKYTRNPNGRRSSYPISPDTVTRIMQDVWGNKMQKTEVAKKYNVSRESIYKHLRENAEKEPMYTEFKPSEVLKRAELSDTERFTRLCNDAAQNMEMTFAIMKKRLEENLRDGEKSTIKTTELIMFAEKMAPYLLEKKTSDKRSGSTKETPKGKAHTMFVSQITKKAE